MRAIPSFLNFTMGARREGGIVRPCVCVPLAACAVATAFYFLTALTPLRSFMVADSVGRPTVGRGRGYWHGRAWRVDRVHGQLQSQFLWEVMLI